MTRIEFGSVLFYISTENAIHQVIYRANRG